jgi:hypothetical protein
VLKRPGVQVVAMNQMTTKFSSKGMGVAGGSGDMSRLAPALGASL